MKHNNFYLNARKYTTMPSYNKTLGETRHYPSSIKEWSDSVYVFNKSYIKDSHSNSMLANNIIKSYFNMDKLLLSTKSKRMRVMLKRKSTKQIFVSKSLTKQTQDKVIISVFIFDRLKKKFNKKLFFLKNNLNNILNNNVVKRRIKRKQHRKIVSRHVINFNSYPKLLNYAFLNKKYNLKNLFFFYFLRWSLSAFNIKIEFLKKGDVLIQNNITRTVNSNLLIIFSQYHAGTYVMKKNTSKLLYLNSKEHYKILNTKDKFTISNINLVNDILYKYLFILMSKSLNKDKRQITNKMYLLFKFFKNKNYKIFIKKFLRKEFMSLYYIYKLYINKVKFNDLLPGLKYILSQIFNKKIELNLINLKYIHLNSDIFTNAISVKLRKKTSKLLRVLKKSLKLVKMPQKMRTDLASFKTTKLLSIDRSYVGINIHNVYNLINKPLLSTNLYRDKFNSLLNNMFSNYNDESLHNNVMTSLKYKWITGVRIEAKGRLTKRFTASRSLFKFKYKGNLRNMDYLNKSINDSLISINKTSTLYMMRNEYKPNIQYTATNSKKRIGTFGLKGWISNN